MGLLLGEMTQEDNDAVGVPSAFQSGQGFPTASEPSIEEEEGYPYPYDVMEPESVYHPFEQPEEPDDPQTREELERALRQYVKWTLKEYDLEIEWERLKLKVDGRFTKALGKCGGDGYHRARVRLSNTHYIDRSYSWERAKETIRHELAHAWQVRWLGYSSHGPTFRQKARELDVGNLSRYDGEGEPKYVAHCQSCGNYYKKYRACKRTRNPYNGCSRCDAYGYELDEIEEDHVWIVWENSDWETVL